jgi:hypothetical protein
MKDEDFEELKNYKSKMIETKINFTNKKDPRNEYSRKSSEKMKETKLVDSAGKKWSRAQTIIPNSKFSIKNKQSDSNSMRQSWFEKKNNITNKPNSDSISVKPSPNWFEKKNNITNKPSDSISVKPSPNWFEKKDNISVIEKNIKKK